MLILSPAYGRDYKSKKAVVADLEANKDFTIESFGPDCGRYINAEQLMPGQKVQIRYARLRKVVVIPIPKVS
jgi:hypothetical protein